jgi:hypothetical protein
LNTLLHVIPDITDPVIDELKGTFPAEIRNGKDTVEGPLQTMVSPFIRIDLLLKKLSVGIGLDIDQVGNIQYPSDTAKILSQFAHNILSALNRQRSPFSPIAIREKNPIQPVLLLFLHRQPVA